MSVRTLRLRQAVDWRAAIWAGLIGGAAFLAAIIVLPWLALGDRWLGMRIMASVVLGPSAVPPPDAFRIEVGLAALGVCLVLSVVFACVVAFVVHRGGMAAGFVGGALIGLALYAINFYTLSYFAPWLFPLRSWMLLVAHAIYGALVGLTYELLEVERFVPTEDSPAEAAP